MFSRVDGVTSQMVVPVGWHGVLSGPQRSWWASAFLWDLQRSSAVLKGLGCTWQSSGPPGLVNLSRRTDDSGDESPQCSSDYVY